MATREQIAALPRRSAREIVALVAGGLGYHERLTIAIEEAINQEWWRGYFAGIDLAQNLTAGVAAREEARKTEEEAAADHPNMARWIAKGP